jgi:sec-independent protein translocase protein TatB
MFDIAFSELVVVALVALIVIGPERLPKVARTAGHLWGRLQRYVSNVKNDIANDMVVEEARKMQSSIQQEVSSVEQVMKETQLTLEQELLQAHHKKIASAASEVVSADAPAPHQSV